MGRITLFSGESEGEESEREWEDGEVDEHDEAQDIQFTRALHENEERNLNQALVEYEGTPNVSDDEMEEARGDRERLEGLIQQKYGKTKEEAREEVDQWLKAA